MNRQTRVGAMIVGMIGVIVMPIGCREESGGGVPRPPAVGSTASKPASSGPTATLPPDHPSIEAPSANGEAAPMAEVDISGVVFADESLTLTGINFKLPAGWERENPGMNKQSPGMSRKAQIRLPKADNEPADAVVAITHFPKMKGPQMDAMNLQRWYGQFTQPDGSPTVGAVTKAVYRVGDVAVTLVDIPGTMAGGRRPMAGGGGDPKADYRMLAAIVDHAKGPHFVKVTGPAAVVERWKPSVVAFLKSAKINQ